MTQDTQVQSRPQADGADRPFDAHDHMRVGHVGPAFTPPASHLLQARDAAVTALVEPLARMLYQAFQAQHLGAFDDVAFEDLTNVAKAKVVKDARVALHLQSPLYRSEAERQVKLTYRDAMKDSAQHFPFLNPVADHHEQHRREQAMAHVLRYLDAIDLPTLMAVAHRMALTEPLKMSEQKQVTLTALRGMF